MNLEQNEYTDSKVHVFDALRKLELDIYNCEYLNSPLYRCAMCPFTSDFKVSLLTHTDTCHHQRQFTEEKENVFKEYKCHDCGLNTFSVLIFAKHRLDRCRRLTGKGLKSFRVVLNCIECAYSTTRKDNLKRHMRSKHDHLITVKWYECEHCPYKSKEKGTLRRHVLNVHNGRKVIRRSYGINVPRKEQRRTLRCCKYCPYTTTKNLVRHMMGKHPNMITVRWFECEYCQFKTKEKAGLIRHTLSKHSDKVTCLKCEGCRFRTTDEEKLNRHISKKHPNGFERRRKKEPLQLMCDRCAYTTIRKGNFHRHMMAVHGAFLHT